VTLRWRSAALPWAIRPSQAKQDDPDFAASVATIELLLKYGADRHALNQEGRTPQQWYRQFGMDELADYMAQRCGAD
jgi:hypothetical protein